MYEHLNLLANLTNSHMTTDQLAYCTAETREQTSRTLMGMLNRGFVRSQVRLNLDGPKYLHWTQTRWTITPLGRLALAQGQRDSRARV